MLKINVLQSVKGQLIDLPKHLIQQICLPNSILINLIDNLKVILQLLVIFFLVCHDCIVFGHVILLYILILFGQLMHARSLLFCFVGV